MSLSAVRQKFRKQGRLNFRSTSQFQRQENLGLPVGTENVPTDTYINETRILTGTSSAFRITPKESKRWWVRWPVQAWRVTGQGIVPGAVANEFRPASSIWSRWIGSLRRWLRRSKIGFALTRPISRSKVNLLLIFVPVAMAAAILPWSPDICFAASFLAVIPLSGITQLAIEDLSGNISVDLGRLLFTISDNVIELVIGIVALVEGHIRLIQLSLIGSVLSYSLLIMGSCFLANGVRFPEAIFESFMTQTICSLTSLALCFLLVPTTIYSILVHEPVTGGEALMLSRAIAIILLLIYAMYTFFQLRSHKQYFVIEDSESQDSGTQLPEGTAEEVLGREAASVWVIISLILVIICAKTLARSYGHTSLYGNEIFVGFILFPFLGNIPEYVCACVVAFRNKMDITIIATLGCSMQILLFTLPFLVILGWIIGQPMSLNFGLFESAMVFVGVVTVNMVLQQSRSNYLHGATCLGLYSIMALAAYVCDDAMLL
ncbi:hypothetical protein N7G274_007961 [Stereocaulon virgatum]|uniref:Vacuolar calcium ion transporter n=1 Tax=Stereocaulon virgatum TaxID=373712 RepID=A0ABR4A7J2_9LECA